MRPRIQVGPRDTFAKWSAPTGILALVGVALLSFDLAPEMQFGIVFMLPAAAGFLGGLWAERTWSARRSLGGPMTWAFLAAILLGCVLVALLARWRALPLMGDVFGATDDDQVTAMVHLILAASLATAWITGTRVARLLLARRGMPLG